MLSYQHRKSHCGDKTILRPSYLHNGISYTRKMSYLYWIGALVIRVMLTVTLCCILGSRIPKSYYLTRAFCACMKLNDNLRRIYIYTYYLYTLALSRRTPWRRHGMEPFSMMLALCDGNPLVTGRCILWCYPEQAVDKTMEWPVILDAKKIRLGAVRQQAIAWANVDPDLCRLMASLGLNELTDLGFNVNISRYRNWSSLVMVNGF